MAAGSIIIPNKSLLNMVNATDLLGANLSNFNLALIGPGWTPDNSDTGNEVYGDVSANEIAAGGGYSTGGINLSGASLSLSGGQIKFSSGSGQFTATGSGVAAWRRGVIYYNGTLNGKVKPIVGHFLGDSTNVDVPATTAPNTLSYTPNAAGTVVVTKS